MKKVLLIMAVVLCLVGCSTQTKTDTPVIETIDESENNEIVDEYFKDDIKIPMFIDNSFLNGYHGKKMDENIVLTLAYTNEKMAEDGWNVDETGKNLVYTEEKDGSVIEKSYSIENKDGALAGALILEVITKDDDKSMFFYNYNKESLETLQYIGTDIYGNERDSIIYNAKENKIEKVNKNETKTETECEEIIQKQLTNLTKIKIDINKFKQDYGIDKIKVVDTSPIGKLNYYHEQYQDGEFFISLLNYTNLDGKTDCIARMDRDNKMVQIDDWNGYMVTYSYFDDYVEAEYYDNGEDEKPTVYRYDYNRQIIIE